MWRNRTPFEQPFPETADAVFAAGQAPPAIVVYVDAWTSYGGSQFVDSPATGRYHSYLCQEVVPWVDARYRTMPDPGHRAIAGKSSGGFGAMITPMLRPDLFGALATHAGDSLYEQCYLRDFGAAVRALRGFDGDIWKWWQDFRSRPPFSSPADARCGHCGRSGLTREPETNTSWMSAQRQSGRNCVRWASQTSGSTSSCLTGRTAQSGTGIRYRSPGCASRWRRATAKTSAPCASSAHALSTR
jgi:hypothetical protein